MTFRFHPQAREDLFNIYEYIADNDPRAAARHIDILRNACRFIGDTPHAGRARPDLGEGLRSFTVDKYLLLYRLTDHYVEIVYIAHGARNLAALIATEER